MKMAAKDIRTCADFAGSAAARVSAVLEFMQAHRLDVDSETARALQEEVEGIAREVGEIGRLAAELVDEETKEAKNG